MKESENHADFYNEIQETLVNNLNRVLRVAGGISQSGELLNMQRSELADASGLSKGTITKLTDTSAYQDAKPDLETLCKLAQALNVAPAFLLMTPSDWELLLQAFAALRTLTKPDGKIESTLAAILEESASNHMDDAVKSGLELMRTWKAESYLAEGWARQRRGILVMTAIAQNAVRRQGKAKKELATALAAFLGDREVAKK